MRHGWLSFEVYSFNVLEKTIPERRFCRDLDALFFCVFSATLPLKQAAKSSTTDDSKGLDL